MLKSERIDDLFRAAMEELALEDVEYCDSIPKTPLLVGDEVRRRISRAARISKVKTACVGALNVLKKVAVACLIVISFAFTCAMCIEPIREAIIEAVVTWYEDHIGFRFESDESSCDMNARPMPTDLPEGWRIELREQNESIRTYEIFGENGEFILYHYIIGLNNEIWVDDHADAVENILFDDGTKAYLTRDQGNGMLYLVWSRDYFGFQLTGYNISAEELIKIASSIK